jgi:hypothetical protein
MADGYKAPSGRIEPRISFVADETPEQAALRQKYERMRDRLDQDLRDPLNAGRQKEILESHQTRLNELAHGVRTSEKVLEKGRNVLSKRIEAIPSDTMMDGDAQGRNLIKPGAHGAVDAATRDVRRLIEMNDRLETVRFERGLITDLQNTLMDHVHRPGARAGSAGQPRERILFGNSALFEDDSSIMRNRRTGAKPSLLTDGLRDEKLFGPSVLDSLDRDAPLSTRRAALPIPAAKPTLSSRLAAFADDVGDKALKGLKSLAESHGHARGGRWAGLVTGTAVVALAAYTSLSGDPEIDAPNPAASGKIVTAATKAPTEKSPEPKSLSAERPVATQVAEATPMAKPPRYALFPAQVKPIFANSAAPTAPASAVLESPEATKTLIAEKFDQAASALPVPAPIAAAPAIVPAAAEVTDTASQTRRERLEALRQSMMQRAMESAAPPAPPGP